MESSAHIHRKRENDIINMHTVNKERERNKKIKWVTVRERKEK
jgi:hypothetical protein